MRARLPSIVDDLAARAVLVVGEAMLDAYLLGASERLCREAPVPIDAEALEARLALYRRDGRRVVLTSGCFDLLHRGHITYLNAAKALGDVLIVGLNSDASIQRLKGPGRPITSLEDGAEVLAALSSVDHIVAFDEDTPAELVRRVRPDVFVKGGDYTRAMLPEASVVEAVGGRGHILPYVEERSTSSIIARIRATASAA